MRDKRVLIGLTLAVCLWAGDTVWAQQAKPWGFAAKAWMTAMSAYKGGHTKQAEALLDDYVRKFGSTEKTPLGYMFLANCRARLGKPEAEDEAIAEVRRRYKGSVWWFAAEAHALRRLKAKGKVNEFLDYLEKFITEAKELPMDFSSDVRAGEGNSTGYSGGSGPWFHYQAPVGMEWLRDIYGGSKGIVPELEAMADTPARRQRVYKILDPIFRRGLEGRLPIGWQYAHLRQLVNLGRIEEAEKLYARYLKDYPPTDGDPRGIMLRVLWGQFWQGRKDDKRADAIYADLIKNYMGFATLSTVLRPRFALLVQENRHREFVPLARAYLKHYPHGYDRKHILDLWVGILWKPALSGDAEALSHIIEMLDSYYGPKSIHRRETLIRFYLEMKKPEEAVKLARPFLNDDEWSRETYLQLRRYAGKETAFAALVDEADKKYGIFAPDPDPNSEPALKLKELKARMKDNQVRHMEEIGDTLFGKHRKTAEAVEGVRLLVEYYFQKVIPGPRDAWMARMIEAYPRHPDTQRVLVRQVEALYAGKFFEKLGSPLDLIQKRFPERARSDRPLAFQQTWGSLRLRAYDAVDDKEGREKMTREDFTRLAKAAEGGNLYAMRAYANHQFRQAGKPDPEARGDYWMKYARKFAGTRAELFCLREAWQAYVNTHQPDVPQDKKVYVLDEALDAIEELQTQKIDPEVAWNTQFADVNLLLAHRKVREALYRLKERIQDGKKIRDVSARLNFGALAGRLAEQPRVREVGLQLVDKKLRKVCFTQADMDWIDNFEIWILYHEPSQERRPAAHRKAMPFFLAKMDKTPIPLRAWGWYQHAMRCASSLGLKASKSVADRYLQRISHCQSLVPGILAGLGHRAMSPPTQDPKVLKEMRERLERRYAASAARGSLENAVEKKRKGN